MKIALTFASALLAALAGVSLVMNADPAPPESAKPVATVVVRDRDPVTRELLPAKAQPKVVKTDEEWRKILSKDAFAVARGKGTERAFCGIFHDNHKTGVYTCACCGLPLFRSDAKFDSGTGWPSFFQPVAKENVSFITDRSHGMIRTEILCARCDCHLGHVFDDGPRPTGLRFCLNSVSLNFDEDPKPEKK